VGEILLDGVSKLYGTDVLAVDAVDLEIADGEFMVLVGPSGCGKTTLLRAIGGLEKITDGRILIGGRDVTRLPPSERDIAMVFQNYALYPHMSVRQNLGYGLRVRNMPKAEAQARVEEVAAMLGLSELLDRRPGKLSGGQQQRVAMGRAIVREPQAFLMDEPLSNLDAKLRIGMRTSLQQLHARLRTTTVYVTHDQVEAMTLGERVAVMRGGRIQQVDVPQRLYHEPENLFVAAFIGSPAMNLVRATLEDDAVVFGGMRVPLARGRRPPAGTRDVILGIRPEAFEDPAYAESGLPRLEVTVEVIEELGSDAFVFFGVDAPVVKVDAARSDDATLLSGGERELLSARLDPHTRARPGRTTQLAVDPERFYFFSPETDESLLSASQSWTTA
jgi:multiple sugar transport system ATP-binding protein